MRSLVHSLVRLLTSSLVNDLVQGETATQVPSLFYNGGVVYFNGQPVVFSTNLP